MLLLLYCQGLQSVMPGKKGVQHCPAEGSVLLGKVCEKLGGGCRDWGIMGVTGFDDGGLVDHGGCGRERLKKEL
jgi:hypothetical protein